MVLGTGCSALVESTLAGRGNMDAATPDSPAPQDTAVDAPQSDTGVTGPCAGVIEGHPCDVPGIAEPYVCILGVCQLSRCGDGHYDDRTGSTHMSEACDDGNGVDGDGCDSDCTFSCTHASDCLDMETCNGMETCTAGHTCLAGTMVMDTTACTIPMTGTAAVCRSGLCRAGACPDGTTDAGEECDDNNANDHDGCDHDCTFSCHDDTDCQDGDPCDGVETCNTTTHVCVASMQTLDCSDGDDCTTDTCVPMMGCTNASVLTDADHDGHFAINATCGGDDCNDANAAAFPGAAEPCGASSDLNCDGHVGTPPVWYVDCDGDTYSHSTAGSVTSCTAPAPGSGCMSPGWTSRVPSGPTSIDCQDSGTIGGPAHPGQTSYYSTSGSISPPYDWDCNGSVAHQVVLFGHPYVQTRTFVECGYIGSPLMYCGGTSYWDQTTLPACGAIGRLSHCAISLGACTRVYTNTTAACH
jgi:cysteine-rich repeat protein